jgi:hypothetical protein
VRSNDSTGETVASVETDTITTRRSVDFDLSGVGGEALGRILSCDTALDSKTTGRDAILSKTKLVQCGTSSDLNLSGNDIDTGDLLSDCVLDLDTRVNLDEVVAVLLVDQKLCSACISVTSSLGQSNSVGENVVADVRREILSRSNLNNLLVSSLNGAVTLVQVDNVTVVVTEKLNLNVLGLVEETFDKDSSVAEGSLGLRGGALERLLETLLLADYSHTTTTTSEGSLDDNGETILVGELLHLLEPCDSARGTRHNRNVGGVGELSGRDLVTERVNDFGRGADELVRG